MSRIRVHVSAGSWIGVMFVVLLGGCGTYGRVAEREAPAEMATLLRVPRTWSTASSVLPVSYLESLPVNPSHTLTELERRGLHQLVQRAHEDSLTIYKQSYYLREDSLLGRLIRHNYPNAPFQEGQIYLGELAEYLEDGS